MASSLMPHENNSIDEVIPTSIRYDNNYSVGNVQPLHKTGFEMEILVVDGDVDGVDKQNVEAHLENLLKWRLTWKLHYHNSIIWAFFKVTNNQSINLFKNQIMKCIICHIEITFLKILAMHIRCGKGLIAYHKFNGIITMKKMLNDRSTLLQKLLVDPTNLAPRSPLDHEPNKKRAHVPHFTIFSFLSYASNFKKDDAIQVVFLEDLVFSMIKRLMPMRTIKLILL